MTNSPFVQVSSRLHTILSSSKDVVDVRLVIVSAVPDCMTATPAALHPSD